MPVLEATTSPLSSLYLSYHNDYAIQISKKINV